MMASKEDKEYFEIGLLEDKLPSPAGLAERALAGFHFVATVGDNHEATTLGIKTKAYYTILSSQQPVVESCCFTPDKNGCDSGIESSPSPPSLAMPEILLAKDPIVMLPYDTSQVEAPAQSILGFYKIIRRKKIYKSFDIWLHIPMHGFQPLPDTSGPQSMRSVVNPVEATKAYFWWHQVLEATGFLRHASLALELDQYFDDGSGRWLSETIGCIIIPTSVMLDPYDHKKEPILSVVHFNFVKRALQLHGCRLMLYDDLGVWEDGRATACLGFLRQMEGYHPEYYIRGAYRLHFTAQPLSQNLGDRTYRRFEEDSVKYTKYQKAIECAFQDLRRRRIAATPRLGNISKDSFVVAVLGCGRGPLISRVLAAAKSVWTTVKVYGVEKNPVTKDILRRKVTGEWKNENVQLVFGDMRIWRPEEKLDMIVSELLGNVADDELSPECLEVPQKLLKEDGISVPQSYHSHIQPISSSVLYVDLQRWYKKKGGLEQMQAFRKNLVEVVQLATEERVFSFSHPDFSPVISNERHSIVEFTANQDGVLHGFAGYFTIVLHSFVELCSVTGRETPGLFSWHPAFFPLVEPAVVREGERIEVEFWRRCNDSTVWYEWQLHQPKQTVVHNLNGKFLKFHKVFQDSLNV